MPNASAERSANLAEVMAHLIWCDCKLRNIERNPATATIQDQLKALTFRARMLAVKLYETEETENA